MSASGNSGAASAAAPANGQATASSPQRSGSRNDMTNNADVAKDDGVADGSKQTMTTTRTSDSNNEAADDGTSAAPAVVVDLTKDLWQNILLNVRDSAAAEASETNLLIVGASGSGKTTLLQRLTTSGGSSSGKGASTSTSTSRKLKPTTALEYSFMRRSVPTSSSAQATSSQQQQQIAHFWELAHGMDMAQLSEVVLTPENVHTVCVAVVVDAAPRGVAVAWQLATYWLRRIDQRVADIAHKMRAKNSSTPDKLLARAKRAIGTAHPDLPRMRLSGVPTVLVINKMDAFASDTARLRTLVRAFRFLAHVYGAYVIFTSEQDAHRWRALMLHVLFQAPFDTRHVQFDAERGAVLLTPDKESFADIGDAGSSASASMTATARTAGKSGGYADADLDKWRTLFDATFPPTLLSCNDSSSGDGDDGSALSLQQQRAQRSSHEDAFLQRLYDLSEDGFGEPIIDALRRQMDEELEQYRRTTKQREVKA